MNKHDFVGPLGLVALLLVVIIIGGGTAGVTVQAQQQAVTIPVPAPLEKGYQGTEPLVDPADVGGVEETSLEAELTAIHAEVEGLLVVPDDGSTGQVLTRTATGYEWADLP